MSIGISLIFLKTGFSLWFITTLTTSSLLSLWPQGLWNLMWQVSFIFCIKGGNPTQGYNLSTGPPLFLALISTFTDFDLELRASIRTGNWTHDLPCTCISSPARKQPDSCFFIFVLHLSVFFNLVCRFCLSEFSISAALIKWQNIWGVLAANKKRIMLFITSSQIQLFLVYIIIHYKGKGVWLTSPPFLL